MSSQPDISYMPPEEGVMYCQRQTDRHTDRHSSSTTQSAQRANSVKILYVFFLYFFMFGSTLSALLLSSIPALHGESNVVLMMKDGKSTHSIDCYWTSLSLCSQPRLIYSREELACNFCLFVWTIKGGGTLNRLILVIHSINKITSIDVMHSTIFTNHPLGVTRNV